MNYTSSRLHIYNNCRPFGIFGIQRFNELTCFCKMDGSLESLNSLQKWPERVRDKFQAFIKNEASKKDPFKGNGDMEKQYFLLHASVISLYDLGAFRFFDVIKSHASRCYSKGDVQWFNYYFNTRYFSPYDSCWICFYF